MTTLTVTTWNVLHRVHALNWNEPPASRFPDERVRMTRIAEKVRSWLDQGPSAVCLQEVSGDQLAELRRELGDRVCVLAHTYRRVPSLRVEAVHGLADPSEHLVTLVAGAAARSISSATFERDDGKGLLAVEIDPRVTLVNTHVSFGKRGVAQLAQIAAVARAGEGRAVVVGDFNAHVDAVSAGLGSEFTVSDLTGQRGTRTASGGKAEHTIDHVAVLGLALDAETVLDGEGLSDHRPVSARVTSAG